MSEQLFLMDINDYSYGMISDPKHLFSGDRMEILSHKSAKEKNFKCFSISFLYNDLFCGSRHHRKPLIILPGASRDHMDIMSFLLPPELLDIIIKSDNVHSIGNNSDYAGFFQLKVYNIKIRDILQNIFYEMGWKRFIEAVRRHITSELSGQDLKQNDELKAYLSRVGNNTIVPLCESEEANRAFRSLLDAGDNRSLALIIANFFISSLLGLRSMKYDTSDRFISKLSMKTYLLSPLGMECIWVPDLISPPYEKLYRIRQVYSTGYYESAYEQCSKWLSEYKDKASSEDLALAYQIIGHSLLKISSADNDDEDSERFSDGFSYLKKCIGTGKADTFVYYFLYDITKATDSTSALEYLEVAFSRGYPEAVNEAVLLYLDGTVINDDITADLLLEKIGGITENEQNYSEVEIRNCLYCRGCLLKHQGKSAEAEAAFELAAKKGHEKAKRELRRKERMARHTFPTFSNGLKSRCCYVNSLTGNNLTFVSTLPDGEWALFTSDDRNSKNINASIVRDIDTFIEEQHLTDFIFQRTRLVFMFMSEDENKNLNECLILLDKLFNLVISSHISEKQKNHLTDSIEIFVGARYEMASMLIDANINDMGNDIYFRVHILDETRDSAHRLLSDAPLFLPFLDKNKPADSADIVLFGCTETNYSIIKESIACAYLGEKYPVTVTLIGAEADRFEKRLHQECPGIYHESDISCIRPVFITCPIGETDFPEYIYGNIHDDKPDDALVNALSRGNYFVVDLSNDYDSIRFATELRTWMLRSGGNFDRSPFIAVKCTVSQNSYLATHLTLSGQPAGDTYYSRYDLFPFGMAKDIYSYQRLIEHPRLEEIALRIHKSYYGGNDFLAENDYFSFSYNADSSLLTAIGLSYRMFAGGAFFSRKEQYLNFGAYDSPDLAADYDAAIRSDASALETAASLEQSRWNGFMLSRGWESADAVKVQAYKNQSTGSSHKHMLAKLHPIIREWSALESDDMRSILGMLKTRFDYNKSPKATTRNSVRETIGFLVPETDGEKQS